MEPSRSGLPRQVLLGFVLIVLFPAIIQVERWRPWSVFGVFACYLAVMLRTRSLLIALTLLGALIGGCTYLLFEMFLFVYYTGSIPTEAPWVQEGGA